MQITTIDFLRHGEVKGGAYYRGRTDDALTEKGWQQMYQAVVNQPWDRVISSPLQRCSHFAEQIKQQDIPLTIDANWQEICFGDWEGKTAAQINQHALMAYYQDPLNNTPPNAEHYADFLNRIRRAWETVLANHTGKHLLLITHAGVIRSLFHLLINVPVSHLFNIRVDHASISQFQCVHDTPKPFVELVFHNKSGTLA